MSLLLVPPNEASAELDGIGHAFFAAVDRDHGGPIVAGVMVALAVVGVVAVVRWLKREAETEQELRALLEARHRAAIAEASTNRDQREWVRVATRVAMKLTYERNAHVVKESCELRNLSAGGGAFTSERPPPPGQTVELALDLGGPRPLTVSGVVVRVEPPTSTSEPSVVGMRFRDLPPRTLEEVHRWVIHEQARELSAKRRGRICAMCQRPLAEADGDMHPACATPRTSVRPSLRPVASRRSGYPSARPARGN
jgi:hypothetical protein